jgi:hypothetical protein
MMVGSFFLKFNNLPPQIPLFYSRGDGEEQMADIYLIFLLPILSIILVSANSLIKSKLFPQVYLIERIIYYVNISIIALTTLIFLKILLVVT